MNFMNLILKNLKREKLNAGEPHPLLGAGMIEIGPLSVTVQKSLDYPQVNVAEMEGEVEVRQEDVCQTQNVINLIEKKLKENEVV